MPSAARTPLRRSGPSRRSGTSPLAHPRRGRPRPRRTGALVRITVSGRRALARLPVGTILVILAAVLAVASLRLDPLDAGLDPSTAAQVVVATVQLDAGTVVERDDIELRTLPAVVVGPAAATGLDAVIGRQVTGTIFEGEPVHDGRLAPQGLDGVAAATPAGWSAFALPVDAALPPAAVGQTVDLYSLGTTTAGSGTTGAAEQVATAGRVVAVDDLRVTVAVEPDDAAAVAAALAGTTVVMAIAGPSPGPRPGR